MIANLQLDFIKVFFRFIGCSLSQRLHCLQYHVSKRPYPAWLQNHRINPYDWSTHKSLQSTTRNKNLDQTENINTILSLTTCHHISLNFNTIKDMNTAKKDLTEKLLVKCTECDLFFVPFKRTKFFLNIIKNLLQKVPFYYSFPFIQCCRSFDKAK